MASCVTTANFLNLSGLQHPHLYHEAEKPLQGYCEDKIKWCGWKPRTECLVYSRYSKVLVSLSVIKACESRFWEGGNAPDVGLEKGSATNFSSSTILPGAGSGGKTRVLTAVWKYSGSRERTDSYKSKPWRSDKVEETDYEKHEETSLHIVNHPDLEIKQYLHKLGEIKSEAKRPCVIFEIANKDDMRQKCLCFLPKPWDKGILFFNVF